MPSLRLLLFALAALALSLGCKRAEPRVYLAPKESLQAAEQPASRHARRRGTEEARDAASAGGLRDAGGLEADRRGAARRHRLSTLPTPPERRP